MLTMICSLWKKQCFFLLLPLMLLCGCSSLGNSAIPSAGASVPKQPSLVATNAAKQAPSVSTAAAQAVFTTYVGKWEVHGSLLTINVNNTGLEQWNAGPCSSSQMCNGNAHIIFIVNTDGSLKGTLQAVNYTQWNGTPAPTGFQPDPAVPQVEDAFTLQHNGLHLLYTTWLGARSPSLNNGNRYWCDAFAVKAGWKQCGA